MGKIPPWISLNPSPPGDLAEIHVPVGAIGNAESTGFLAVDNLVEIHRGRENVDQHLATHRGHNPGSELGTASKLEGRGVNSEHMTHDTEKSLGIGFDRADEMTMRFELKMPALDQVDLLARGHDRGLHGRDRTRTVVSTGIRIRACKPEGESQLLPVPSGRVRNLQKGRSTP